MRQIERGTSRSGWAWGGDRLAVVVVALASTAVLCLGSSAASGLAVNGVVGVTRTHAELASRAQRVRPANYGELFEYAVAPVRTDAAATIKSIRIEMRELLPLPWGWGYA